MSAVSKARTQTNGQSVDLSLADGENCSDLRSMTCQLLLPLFSLEVDDLSTIVAIVLT